MNDKSCNPKDHYEREGFALHSGTFPETPAHAYLECKLSKMLINEWNIRIVSARISPRFHDFIVM